MLRFALKLSHSTLRVRGTFWGLFGDFLEKLPFVGVIDPPRHGSINFLVVFIFPSLKISYVHELLVFGHFEPVHFVFHDLSHLVVEISDVVFLVVYFYLAI